MTLTLSFGKIDEACALMREVAAWGRGMGFRVWPDAWLTREALLADGAQASEFCIGSVDGEPACAFLLKWEDAEWWPDAPPLEAAYIHKLCVRRSFAHQSMTKAVVEAVKAECRKKGVQYIRLDTALDETKVKQIYLDCGFRIVRTIDLPSGRSMALYEIQTAT